MMVNKQYVILSRLNYINTISKLKLATHNNKNKHAVSYKEIKTSIHACYNI